MIKIERAVIEINGGCNYSCAMCPQSSPGRSKNFLKKMSLKDFESNVIDAVNNGAYIINLEGSGEPTLQSNLAEYVKIVKKYGAKAYIFSNGMKMRDDYMKAIVDAGVDFFRFSVIGYDNKTYTKWMNSPFFNLVIKNIKEMQKYVEKTNSSCTVAVYHLLLDNNNIEYEKEQYLSLTADLPVEVELWKMHNWSGVYDPAEARKGEIKTCGRPFSPDIVIRAGGLEGKTGAVHPCCQVLGRDDEAVLGHTSENTIKEIWEGEAYTKLREDHTNGNYPSFCEGCDFLVSDPEVLVYSSHATSEYQMHGVDFSLDEYR